MHTTSKPRGLTAAGLAACLALGVALAGLLPGVAAAQNTTAAAPAKPGDFRGYSGVHWPTDFAVRSGHCDRERITETPRRSGAVASLGQRRELNRSAAMLIGARVADLLPGNLGAEVDEGDQACMGQVLELGASGRWVSWDNASTGIHYQMRPDSGRDGIAGSCRAFRLKVSGNYHKAKRTAMACQSGPGLWQLSGL